MYVSERVDVIKEWMKGLNQHLLHVNEWNNDDMLAFSSLVSDIQNRWNTVTNKEAFSKLHMLTHTLEFARTHKFLGCMSESFIESSHVKFNVLKDRVHNNSDHDTKMQLRRSLADMALTAIRTALLEED